MDNFGFINQLQIDSQKKQKLVMELYDNASKANMEFYNNSDACVAAIRQAALLICKLYGEIYNIRLTGGLEVCINNDSITKAIDTESLQALKYIEKNTKVPYSNDVRIRTNLFEYLHIAVKHIYTVLGGNKSIFDKMKIEPENKKKDIKKKSFINIQEIIDSSINQAVSMLTEASHVTRNADEVIIQSVKKLINDMENVNVSIQGIKENLVSKKQIEEIVSKLQDSLTSSTTPTYLENQRMLNDIYDKLNQVIDENKKNEIDINDLKASMVLIADNIGRISERQDKQIDSIDKYMKVIDESIKNFINSNQAIISTLSDSSKRLMQKIKDIGEKCSRQIGELSKKVESIKTQQRVVYNNKPAVERTKYEREFGNTYIKKKEAIPVNNLSLFGKDFSVLKKYMMGVKLSSYRKLYAITITLLALWAVLTYVFFSGTEISDSLIVWKLSVGVWYLDSIFLGLLCHICGLFSIVRVFIRLFIDLRLKNKFDKRIVKKYVRALLIIVVMWFVGTKIDDNFKNTLIHVFSWKELIFTQNIDTIKKYVYICYELLGR